MRLARFRVPAVVLHQLPVVLHHHAAAARGDDDRLDVAIDVRPPDVDVAPDDGQRALLAAQVMRQRAATARGRNAQQRDPDPVEHAGERGVDAGRERSLHAGVEREHLPPVPRGRPRARRTRVEDLRAELAGSTGLSRRPDRQRNREERTCEQRLADRASGRPRGDRPRRALVDDVPSDVEEPSVLDAGGTRGLAAPAREAAIEMEPGLRGHLAALEHLLDEIDAPARSVELVAQQQVRRARRRAEAAVHARAQDRVRVVAFGRVADEVGEGGLHADQRPQGA